MSADLHAPLTNIFKGTATFIAGSATVSLPQILSTSIVLLSMAATNNTGTPEYAITAGTGFVISSSQAGDTGSVSWLVVL